MKAEPINYQIEAIERHVDAIRKYGSSLDASDTGTGKTFVALFTAKRLGLSPSVICPKAVIGAWKAAARAVGVELIDCINYEMAIRRSLAFPEFLIFDEAHRCGGIGTKNSKLLLKAKAHRIPHMMISATPADSPLRMQAIGVSLDLFELRRFYPWMYKHGVRDTPFGKQFSKPAEMVKIFDAIGPRLIRIRKSEVPGFPPVQNHFLELEPAKVTPKRNDYIAFREAIEFSKVPQILELVKDRDGSRIVFTSFRETFHALAEKLENPALVYGGQDEAERLEGLDEFQENKRKTAVVMIQAGGVGISLHDLIGDSPRTSFICLPESAVHFKQALGRINRAGQKSFAENIILHTRGSFEDRIVRRVKRKIDSIDNLIDGDLESPELREKFETVNV